MKTLTCARSPCSSCPYRRDVPSGVWAANEYEKLAEYDEIMPLQPQARFDCHQRDGKLCAGWVATHGAMNLLALRLAAARMFVNLRVDPDVFEYQTDVPVFRSGREAMKHGLKGIARPSRAARELVQRLMAKVARGKA
jgi:hypothetical protein